MEEWVVLGLKGVVRWLLQWGTAGLRGGGLGVIGKKLSYEVGVHCDWLDGVVDGEWLVVRVVECLREGSVLRVLMLWSH